MKRLVFILLLLLLLLPSTLFAWGGDGHQITCLIAEDRLTPAAKAGIHELLGKDVNISDAEIASWADQIRRERRDTANFHFVDTPFDSPAFDEHRDGQNGNNVIDKVIDFENILKDPKARKADRIEALKFLVHLVGDLHHMHCTDRNDRGGTKRLVFFLAKQRATNLHMVWDSAILLQHKGAMRNAAYADKLNAQITPELAAEWAKGSPADWADESHKIAIDVAYKGVPTDGAPPKLDQAYVDRAAVVTERQLERGGVRLAGVLNGVFR